MSCKQKYVKLTTTLLRFEETLSHSLILDPFWFLVKISKDFQIFSDFCVWSFGDYFLVLNSYSDKFFQKPPKFKLFCKNVVFLVTLIAFSNSQPEERSCLARLLARQRLAWSNSQFSRNERTKLKQKPKLSRPSRWSKLTARSPELKQKPKLSGPSQWSELTARSPDLKSQLLSQIRVYKPGVFIFGIILSARFKGERSTMVKRKIPLVLLLVTLFADQVWKCSAQDELQEILEDLR